MFNNSQKTSSRLLKKISTNYNYNNNKKVLGKATGHRDHYMIIMGGQRAKIGGNWPLTGPYLQRCTYGTLNMFLLSVQTNFYVILSSYIEEHRKKKSSLRFISLVYFQVLKVWTFFGKFTVELILKSFSGRSNSVSAFVFRFSNNRLYDLEESIEFKTFINWVLG